MKNERIEFLSAVLLVTKNLEQLAAFYKDIVGLPLESEEHGETKKHYGCELGDLHFAIHPIDNFAGTGYGTGSIKLAFTVFDLKGFIERAEAKGAKFAYPPKDTGFALMTALTDPDGNYIEFTQLSNRWFQHLEKRKEGGADIVARWKSLAN